MSINDFLVLPAIVLGAIAFYIVFIKLEREAK